MGSEVLKEVCIPCPETPALARKAQVPGATGSNRERRTRGIWSWFIWKTEQRKLSPFPPVPIQLVFQCVKSLVTGHSKLLGNLPLSS